MSSANDSGTMGADDTLDMGLAAAFGRGSRFDDSENGVVATLQAQIGECHSVVLRDDPEEPSSIVRPIPSLCEITPSTQSRYQVYGEIARGGVGIILKGRDVDLGRDVAMKVLRPDLLEKPGMTKRFVEEAQIAGQLQHPGIVPVYELGLENQRRPFFTMKLVRGQTLHLMLQKGPPSFDDRQRLFRIFAKVCETVAYAHAKGVIHRDLKPANILVGQFGEVHVVDWGLAKVLTGKPSSSVAASDSMHAQPIATIRSGASGAESLAGSIMGTPAYMAPEQARGDVDQLDERADVFSLGAILLEILTGQPPYVGDSGRLLAQAAEGKPSAALEKLHATDIDPDLVVIVSKCLRHSPQERPASAGVVADMINSHLESLERRAHEASLAAAQAQAVASGERRARRLTLALASTLLIAIILGAGGWLWIGAQDDARRQEVTQQVAAAIESASMKLGLARAAPLGDSAPWVEAVAAGEHLTRLLEPTTLDPDTRRRADAFLRELAQADADRRVVEKLEEVVIVGATHNDRESWEWMERSLRKTFSAYGINLEHHSKEEIAERIQQSRIAARLADVLELWIATNFRLREFGGGKYKVPELLQWVELLYVADPDPFRTDLRKLIYTGMPPLEKLQQLTATAKFEQLEPRTLSWLGTAFFMARSPEEGLQVFERAARLHPQDFMLQFDYAFMFIGVGKHREAIPQLYRCIGIRPGVGGLWRSVGIAQREVGDLPASIKAFEESIRHQSDYAPTHVDLAATLIKAKKQDEAVTAANEAIRLKPELAEAHAMLGIALFEQDKRPEAEAPLRQAVKLSENDRVIQRMKPDWLKRCSELLKEYGNSAGD